VEVKDGETALAASTEIPSAWGSLATAFFSLGEYVSHVICQLSRVCVCVSLPLCCLCH